MKKVLLSLISSKKFIAMIVGLILTMLAKANIGLSEASVTEIVALIMSYIVGQGIADHGKEKAKIENGKE